MQVDPLRLRQLQSRFGDDLGGPCPGPAFEGAQQFFRDFIFNCNDHNFLVHLSNALVEKISEMNGETFSLGESFKAGGTIGVRECCCTISE